MFDISFIGSPALLAGIGALLAFFIFRNGHRMMPLIICSILLGNALTPILKHFFARPRPGLQYLHVFVHETDSSFPSGHAIGATLFVFAMVLFTNALAPRYRWWPRLLGGILIILVCLSRLYLGVHWISDELAGIAVAILWLLFCRWAIWPYLQKIPKNTSMPITNVK